MSAAWPRAVALYTKFGRHPSLRFTQARTDRTPLQEGVSLNIETAMVLVLVHMPRHFLDPSDTGLVGLNLSTELFVGVFSSTAEAHPAASRSSVFF